MKTTTRSHKIIPFSNNEAIKFSNNETIKFRIEYQNKCRRRVDSNLLINENFSTRIESEINRRKVFQELTSEFSFNLIGCTNKMKFMLCENQI